MPSAFSRPPIRCSSPGVPGSPTAARASPGRAGTAGSRSPSFGSVANSVEMSGSVGDVRDQPRLGAVREVGVREQVDGRAVLERDPRRLDRGVEAAATGSTRRSPAPATRSCGRSSTISRSACSGFVGIPVEGPARWMSRISSGSSSATARPIVSDLSTMPGPAEAVTPSAPPNGRAERRAGRRDLVLGLEGAHAEVLVPRELLQDRGRGRDRVGAEEERQARELRRRRAGPNESACCR